MTGTFVESMFTGVLNQSILASWLILAVVLIRVCMKKTPKSLRYVLWALVAVRLLCPVSIESTWSLVPSIEVSVPLSDEDRYLDSVIVEGAETLGIIQNQQNMLQNVEENVEVLADEVVDITEPNTLPKIFSLQGIFPITTGVWIVGMVVFVFSSVINVSRLKKKVGASLQIGKNVWMCDEIQTPFILGVVSPHIYVPSFITHEQLPFILAHENEHLKYRDHWWKPFGFAILTIHWFNPLVWIAYILLCRDMELACDERVIQCMDEEEKKQYSKSLLLCNNPRNWISACPVAFGEVGVKERVKSILNYKKSSTWMVGIGVCVCIIIAVCFMTNPKRITLDLDVDKVAKIELRSGSSGKDIEITDEDLILRITNQINKLEFQKKGSTAGNGGWSYWLIWYDAEGNEMESFTTVGDNRIAKDDYFYQCVNGTLDNEYYKELLQEKVDDLSVITAEKITEMEAAERTTDELGKEYTSMLDVKNGYVLRCTSPAASQMIKVICKISNDGTVYLDVSDLPNYPCGIYFFTKDIGYIITDYHGSDNFLYRTEDGGKTWSSQAVYIPDSRYRYVNGLSIEDGILCIEVVLDENVFYYTYTTDDMGKTWQMINSERDDIIIYEGRIYKKAELCDATLQWLELSEMERSLSSYFPPEFAVFAEKWGVTLDVEDVTPTSLTLKCTQSGGRPTGELQTGTWYVLQTWTQEYGWSQVDYLPHEYEIAWTQEAWIIPMNDTCEWEVNWEWLYGELPEGKYRIGKEIMDFRDAGDYDSTIYYAEFEIVK